MNITDIRIRRTWDRDHLRALVSVTVDNALAIHDVKVIAGPDRFFVAMPSRKDADGVFRDTVHPTTREAREELESKVLAAYYEHIEAAENAAQE